ncbi:3-hydroxybutyryl-CoA dehydrogenase [Streptomyces capillispiralis]|uniref:3-hydroxybutyryl-CoA dehydrogenase n=1 Tax=Streptomyces capillispiralis TaxID=68182 RepID=A0A561TRY2_9ACTN|nr:3-hydroxybutyryl-CoA dehydrogenase [Streptomyces capillispiralis]TWF89847.1 3-hydroxybutyryl-CoA dehydrogenase [Streptomyces capillispiralis]GHH95669.1 3-hydroxybutyryl-CoA dehydrogenase [Streptomyces capillispiralis]
MNTTTEGTPPVHRVGIVGCGLMGSGIAEVCARAGLDVTVAVSRPASVQPGLDRIRTSLGRAVAKGRMTEDERDAALGRIEVVPDLKAMADRQFVVEAIREDEAAKVELFASLDAIVEDPDAILATNTSSLPVTRLARSTDRPGRVVGVHFFSPVPMLPLVELTSSLLTEEQVADRAERFVSDVLGKEVIRTADRAGFVVNALLFPYLVSAIRMAESGFATAEVIDRGMRLGCSHPLGPLQLCDLIGLDVVASIAGSLYEEYKEPLYAPPSLLIRMVEGGLLGRKTGRGFYTYDR